MATYDNETPASFKAEIGADWWVATGEAKFRPRRLALGLKYGFPPGYLEHLTIQEVRAKLEP